MTTCPHLVSSEWVELYLYSPYMHSWCRKGQLYRFYLFIHCLRTCMCTAGPPQFIQVHYQSNKQSEGQLHRAATLRTRRKNKERGTSFNDTATNITSRRTFLGLGYTPFSLAAGGIFNDLTLLVYFLRYKMLLLALLRTVTIQQRNANTDKDLPCC